MYAQNLCQTIYLLCLKSICLKTYREEKQFEKKVDMAKKTKGKLATFSVFLYCLFFISNCLPCRRTPDQTLAITIEVLLRTTASSDLYKWVIEWFVIIRFSSHLPFWKVTIRVSLQVLLRRKSLKTTSLKIAQEMFKRSAFQTNIGINGQSYFSSSSQKRCWIAGGVRSSVFRTSKLFWLAEGEAIVETISK